MKDSIYLILTKNGVGRMTKRSPALSRNEIGVLIRITAPDNAFRAPILAADLDVADGQILQPTIQVEGVEQEPEVEP